MGVHKFHGRKGFEGCKDFASSSLTKRTMIIVSSASLLRLLVVAHVVAAFVDVLDDDEAMVMDSKISFGINIEA